jgi:uncharacterized OsmC-like protein
MSEYNTKTEQDNITNNVNVTALFNTIDAVKQDAQLADFRFRASNLWIDGGHNRSTIKGFYGCRDEDSLRTQTFTLDADEPEVLLGQDKGANPVEFVLHALAACMTTTMVYHAAARGIEIKAVESSLEGDLDLRGFLGLSDEVRKGYRQVRVNFKVQCNTDASLLRELAQFSPVYDMISNSLPVEVNIETY